MLERFQIKSLFFNFLLFLSLSLFLYVFVLLNQHCYFYGYVLLGVMLLWCLRVSAVVRSFMVNIHKKNVSVVTCCRHYHCNTSQTYACGVGHVHGDRHV